MSNLFSRIYSGAVTLFHAAEAEIDGINAKLRSIPGVAALEDAEVSVIKQQVSNALAFVDTELKPHFADAVEMVESAIDTGLLAFGTASLGPAGGIIVKAATPGVNAGATLFFNQLRAVIDHAEADFKANANLPAPTSSDKPSADAVASALAGAITVVGTSGAEGGLVAQSGA